MRRAILPAMGAGVLMLVAACGTHPLIPASALRPTPPVSVPAAPAADPVAGVDVYVPTKYPLRTVKKDGARVMSYVHNLHANAVGLVWNLCTPSMSSDVVTACSGTQSVVGIRILTRLAEADGLAVQYRPLIRVGPVPGWNTPGVSWEGFIRPASERAWFASLYHAEFPYLQAAQALHVSQFVTGTELRRVTVSGSWSQFLTRVRSVYKGSVSYAAHQYDYLHQWMPPVTAYGVDPYPDLHLPDTATQAQVTAGWERFFARVPAAVRERTTFDEVGFASVDGAYSAPQQWNRPGPANYVMQVRWFTAACQTAAHYHMAGIYFYNAGLAGNPVRPSGFPAAFEGRKGAAAIRSCLRTLRDGTS